MKTNLTLKQLGSELSFVHCRIIQSASNYLKYNFKLQEALYQQNRATSADEIINKKNIIDNNAWS